MSNYQKPRLIEKIMSRSSTENTTSANTSSKNEVIHIIVAELPPPTKDGVNIMLQSSTDHLNPNQANETEVVDLRRYLNLQNEYQSLINRFNFMKDEFAEMRIELARLREERDKAWARSK